MDYVQVPIEDDAAQQPQQLQKETTKNTEQTTVATVAKNPTRPTPSALHGRLVKQIHVSSSGEGAAGLLVKSGSESSLSEDSSQRRGSTECESSAKEWRSEQQDEKDVCSDNEDSTTPALKDASSQGDTTVVRRRRSRVTINIRIK